MANEITITASLAAFKAAIMSSAIGRAVSGLSFTMNGNDSIQKASFSVATSATLIPLGGIAAPHWAWFRNLDATNYVQLQNGVSGAVFARLYPGEFFLGPLDNGSTPYAIANTAPILLEYLILAY